MHAELVRGELSTHSPYLSIFLHFFCLLSGERVAPLFSPTSEMTRAPLTPSPTTASFTVSYFMHAYLTPTRATRIHLLQHCYVTQTQIRTTRHVCSQHCFHDVREHDNVTSDPSACCDLCKANPDCNAFTLQNGGARGWICGLKQCVVDSAWATDCRTTPDPSTSLLTPMPTRTPILPPVLVHTHPSAHSLAHSPTHVCLFFAPTRQRNVDEPQ